MRYSYISIYVNLNNLLVCIFITGEAGKMADAATMISICDNIHVVLIKTEITGETTLVSSLFFEWRPVLSSNGGRMGMLLELKGVGVYL